MSLVISAVANTPGTISIKPLFNKGFSALLYFRIVGPLLSLGPSLLGIPPPPMGGAPGAVGGGATFDARTHGHADHPQPFGNASLLGPGESLTWGLQPGALAFYYWLPVCPRPPIANPFVDDSLCFLPAYIGRLFGGECYPLSPYGFLQETAGQDNPTYQWGLFAHHSAASSTTSA